MRKLLLLIGLLAASQLEAAIPSFVDVTNIVNALASGAGSSSSGNAVFLDAVNGNDSTGTRGNSGKPYLTWTNAVEALQNNDTLIVRAGRYFAFSAFQGYTDNTTTRRAAANLINKTNVTIMGLGNPTIWYTNQCDVLDIFASTNITVRDLTMECTIRLPGSGWTNTSATIEMRGNSSSCKFINVRLLNYPNHGITGSFQTVTNCLVDSCYFYNGGYSNGVPSLGQDGASIVPGSYWTIRNCEFDSCFRGIEFFYNTVSLATTRNVTVNGCKFTRFYADAPIWSQNQVSGTDAFFDIDIYDNRIVDCNNLGSTWAGISMAGGSIRLKVHNNRVIDTTVNSLGSCIQVSTFGANNVESCEISDNYTEGGGAQGILLWDVGTVGVATNCVIRHNKVRRTLGQGVAMSARDSKILNNDIFTCVNAGVYLWDNSSGGGQRNSVINNDICIAGAGAPSGVKLDAGSTNELVQFNRISGYASQAILDAAPVGFNKHSMNTTTNGWFFNGTNESSVVAASEPIFTQIVGVASTNITTTTNTLFGPGDGSLTLYPGFWRKDKTLHLLMQGQYWAGATPGNSRVMVNLNSGTTPTTLTQTLLALPANQSAQFWKADIYITCMTNSATGAWRADGTLKTLAGSAVTEHTFTNLVTIGNTLVAQALDVGSTNGALTDSLFSTVAGVRAQ